jgi:transposase
MFGQMPRHAPKLECAAEVREQLVGLSKGRIVESRVVERARMILACLDGKEIQQVAKELRVSVVTVSKWRSRFALFGIRGLQDNLRPGKPAKYGRAFRDRVLKLLEQPPPDGYSHWEGPLVAERLGASVHAVWRVLRREGIYLQRLRSWCVSTDPQFAVKAADVVGLYLDPPLNAIVLSVDEKPSIQAIERSTGYVETDSGAVVRALKSTYKRHGTLNLFAALNVASGYVYGKTTEKKKREDFQQFLRGVIAELPSDLEIHVILDNYCTHKRNQDWLANYDGRVHFHFTPTSASWLNQVEIFFSIFERRTLRGASFQNKDQLRAAIQGYLARHNQNPRPFRWRKREVKGSQLRNTILNLCN